MPITPIPGEVPTFCHFHSGLAQKLEDVAARGRDNAARIEHVHNRAGKGLAEVRVVCEKNADRLITLVGEDGKNGWKSHVDEKLKEIKIKQFRLILFAVAIAMTVGTGSFAAAKAIGLP